MDKKRQGEKLFLVNAFHPLWDFIKANASAKNIICPVSFYFSLNLGQYFTSFEIFLKSKTVLFFCKKGQCHKKNIIRMFLPRKLKYAILMIFYCPFCIHACFQHQKSILQIKMNVFQCRKSPLFIGSLSLHNHHICLFLSL